MRKWLVTQLRRTEWFKHDERRRCYRACFVGPEGEPTQEAETVLADLRRFCKASHSSFVPGDPHATALNEGRREVWLRIMEHLHLSDDTIAAVVEATYPDTDAGGFEE